MYSFRVRFLLSLLALTLAIPLFGPSSRPASAQGNSQTFPETGKTLSGKFLDYWKTHGGLPQQGFPISEEMQEKSDTDGKTYTVQYFERAVFELHPENVGTQYEVLLSLLGNFYYAQKYPNGASDQKINGDNAVKFSETGHTLGGVFRQYWEKNGGLAQQGFPISEEFTEKSDLDGNSYTVQYFERAVFEMHPEKQPPYNVLLSQLGTFRYRAKYEQPPVQPTAQPTEQPTAVPAPTAQPQPTSVSNSHQALRVLTGHTGQVYDVEFSPDGQTLASAGEDKTIRLWRVSDGSPLRTLTGNTGAVGNASFLPDGQTLISAGEDKTVRLWRLSDGALLSTWTFPTAVCGVILSPDHETAAAYFCGPTGTDINKKIELLKLSDGTVLNTLEGHTAEVENIAFSPDGQMLVSIARDSTRLWRVSDGTLIQKLIVEGTDAAGVSAVFSPDGKLLATSSGASKRVRIWRVSDWTLLSDIEAASYESRLLAFSPDSHFLAGGILDGTSAANSQKSITLWRVDESIGSLTVVNSLIGHTGTVGVISFSPDGKLLASCSEDGSVRLWDTKDLR